MSLHRCLFITPSQHACFLSRFDLFSYVSKETFAFHITLKLYDEFSNIQLCKTQLHCMQFQFICNLMTHHTVEEVSVQLLSNAKWAKLWAPYSKSMFLWFTADSWTRNCRCSNSQIFNLSKSIQQICFFVVLLYALHIYVYAVCWSWFAAPHMFKKLSWRYKIKMQNNNSSQTLVQPYCAIVQLDE